MAKPRPIPSKPHVLVLGTGIGGLSCAIKFAERGHRVVLVSKVDAAEGATRYAQGGIASVWTSDDSFEEHQRDTLNAGDGLCDEEIVKICVQEGPTRVRELINWGVEFTKKHGSAKATENSDYDLHREGGHGKHRILHADDLTGWSIEKALLARARSLNNITLLEQHVAIDLITEGKIARAHPREPGRCLGAYVLDTHSGQVIALQAHITVLATGGAGKTYLYTSNPDVATGDGIAMAYRAGAEVANLEFMQFHPTCLYHPQAKTFLITEAMRGEGAVLRSIAGVEFMKDAHPMGSLAPRDIVARAIDREIKRSGATHVDLDCRNIESVAAKFPNIYATCLKWGIDIAHSPIPVVPAAHYLCGGVKVDADGCTTIAGLYAVGEVACTGLHGANRLASNSLLEATVFAHRIVEHAQTEKAGSSSTSAWNADELRADLRANATTLEIPPWDSGNAVKLEDQIDIAALWLELRTLMWNYVGIVRSEKRLHRALARLEILKRETEALYWNFILTKDMIELRNIVTVAELIAKSALARKESRGLHFTLDHPEKAQEASDTVLKREAGR